MAESHPPKWSDIGAFQDGIMEALGIKGHFVMRIDITMEARDLTVTILEKPTPGALEAITRVFRLAGWHEEEAT